MRAVRQPREYCESLSLEHLLAMFFFGHVASLALHIEDRTEASGVPLRYWTVLADAVHCLGRCLAGAWTVLYTAWDGAVQCCTLPGTVTVPGTVLGRCLGRPAWPQAKVSFLSVDGKFMIKQLGSIPSVSLKRCVHFSIYIRTVP